MALQTKICAGCDQQFEGRPNAKACSPKCRKRLFRARQAISQEVEKLAQMRDAVKEDIQKSLSVPQLASAIAEAGFNEIGAIGEISQATPTQAPTNPALQGPTLQNTQTPADPSLQGPTLQDLQGSAQSQPEVISLETRPTTQQWQELQNSWESSAQPAPASDSLPNVAVPEEPIGPTGSKFGNLFRNRRLAISVAFVMLISLVSGGFAINGLFRQDAAQQADLDSLKGALDAAILDTTDGNLTFNFETIIDAKLGIGMVPEGDASLQVAGDIQSTATLFASDGESSLNNDGLTIDNVVVCTSGGCNSNIATETVLLQAAVLGTQQVGNIYISGTVTAGNFSGNGSGLANVNAALLQGNAASFFTNAGNISSGTLSDARLSSNVTLLGQTIESSEITDGTIVNADISAAAAIAYSKLNLADSIVSADISNGTIVNIDIGATAAIDWSKISKTGSSLADLTTRSASDLSSGTLAIARGGTGAGTSQAAIDNLSGLTTAGDLLYYDGANSTRLARGADGSCLQSSALTIAWTACTGLITLQNAYVNGNSITTTTARDIDLILDDSATDSNLDIDLIADNTVTISRNDGASAEAPAQLLLLENLDTNLTVAAGLLVNVAAGGVITTALDVSDDQIATALAIGSNNITTGATTISSAELDLLDGHDVALVDTNDAVATAIIGTGALASGSIAAGFGTISTANTITGTTLNGTTGINTGAGAGTQRIDVSGNLVNIGNLTATGAITIASAGAGNDVTVDGADQFIVSDASLFKNGADSTTAFQVQNAAGNELLLVNTTGSLVALGKASTVTGNLTFFNSGGAGNISLQGANPGAGTFTVTLPAATGTVCLTTGNCAGVGGTGDILQGGNTFGTAVTLGANDNFGLNLETNNVTVASLSNSGAALFKNASDSTTAFQVQNAAAARILNVDTTGGEVEVGQASSTTGKLVLFESASAGSTTLQAAAPGASAFAITLPAATGTVCLTTGNCAGVGGTGDILQGGNTFGTAVTIGTNDGFGLNLETNNTTVASFTSGGAALFKNSADSTTAFRLQNLAGNNFILMDTTGSSLSIGDAGIASTVQIGNTTGAVAQTVNIGNNATALSTTNVTIGNLLSTSATTIQGGTGASAISLTQGAGGTITIGGTGGAAAVSVQCGTGTCGFGNNATDHSTTLGSATGTSLTTLQGGTGGITLQAAGTAAIDVIQIGAGGVGSATPDFLALDVKSDTGDPAGGAEGYMYYNTFDNKFRCYESAGWTNCIPAGATTTLQDAYGNDADGSDTIISQTSDDDGLIFRNPDSGGSDSTYILTLDQLEDDTGTHGGLSIQSAGTGNLLLITDTTATARDVMTIADGGATTFRNQTDSTTAFRVQNAAGTTTILNIDITNSELEVGGNVIASTAPSVSTATQTQTNVVTTDDSGSHASAATGTDGFPIIAYYEDTNDNLEVVHCTNISCSTSDTPVELDTGGSVGQYTSIAIGTDGFPLIAYYDVTNTALKVVHCTNATCTSNDTPVTVDNRTSGGTGTYANMIIGDDGFGVIAYHCASSGNNECGTGSSNGLDLMVAHCTNTSCSTNNGGALVEQTNSTGEQNDIVLSTDGFPFIISRSFDNDAGDEYDIRTVKCGNADCSSGNTSTLHDDGNATPKGHYTAAVMGADSRAVVAFAESGGAGGGDMWAARCNSAQCTSLSMVEIEAAADAGPTSMAMGTDGTPIISWYDSGTSSLVVAKCSDSRCSSGTNDTVTTVDDTGTTGNYNSMIVPSDGLPFIAYYDAGANLNLRATKCAVTDCSITSTDSYSGGYNIGSSTNYFNSVYAVKYFGKNLSLNSFDVAEEYEVEDTSLRPGEAVALNPATGKLRRATSDDRNYLLGTISTEPGLALRDYEANRTDTRLVALSGRVPMKVKGPVSVGDPLTISDTPGVAQKATTPGLILGRALGDFGEGQGIINMFVQTTYYSPAYDLQADAVISSLATSGLLSTGSLAVEGPAKFKGEITLAGHIITEGETPTATAEASAGQNATVAIEGNDQSGLLTITCGANSSAGQLITINFKKPYGKIPKVILTPANDKASELKIYYTSSLNSFNIHTSSEPVDNSTYKLSYLIVQ